MPEIIRIVIKGSSGYCCVDEAFNDKYCRYGLCYAWVI